VELSAETNEILDDIVEQGKLGGKIPKVITDLLERIGPSTKQAAEAEPGPLTYKEARIVQSNASELSSEEKMALKGKLRYLMPKFAKSFGQDVQAAADQAGIGPEHAGGMWEYARGAKAEGVREAIAERFFNPAVKGAAGAVGAGVIYELYRILAGQK
jgi:hypothetical protein